VSLVASEVAAPFVLTKTNSVLFGALIGAIAAGLGAVLSAWITSRNERSRQRHALAMSRLEHEDSVRTSRLDNLRSVAAEYATLAIAEGELASLLLKKPALTDVRQRLLEGHGSLRSQYELLLLTSDSVTVHERARDALRVTWNERAEALGWDRKHERPLPNEGPVKNIRYSLEPFILAVREELGIHGPIGAEPVDYA
jgi:hypothetical protein